MGIRTPRLELDDFFDHFDSALRNAEPAGDRGQHLHARDVIRVPLQNLAALNLCLVQIPLAISSHRVFEQLIKWLRSFCQGHASSPAASASAGPDSPESL